MKLLFAALLAISFALPASAVEVNRKVREYESTEAGHPLRIAAYALHPVGVIIDYLIMYPAWVIGSYEPIRTLVGREAPLPVESLPGPDAPRPAPSE